MYTKRIPYVDYNGEKREEDFRFNFTKAEMVEMEMTAKGGLKEKIQRIIDAKDRSELVKIFKSLILDSYGVKSPDGSRFVKNDRIRDDFYNSPAYSEMFMLLSTSDEEAAKFINGVMPDDMPKVEIDPVTGEPRIIENGKIVPMENK